MRCSCLIWQPPVLGRNVHGAVQRCMEAPWAAWEAACMAGHGQHGGLLRSMAASCASMDASCTAWNTYAQHGSAFPAMNVSSLFALLPLPQYLRPHQREGVAFMFECVCGLRKFDGQGGQAHVLLWSSCPSLAGLLAKPVGLLAARFLTLAAALQIRVPSALCLEATARSGAGMRSSATPANCPARCLSIHCARLHPGGRHGPGQDATGHQVGRCA